MDGDLEALLDERAIRAVLGRYARAVDRLDLALLRSCYHDDATEDRGRYRGGVDGFVDWISDTLAGLESTWHMVGPALIELNGDRAWAESYCLGAHRAGAEDRLIPCRYVDRFERRAGDWRIASRLAVYEPAIVVPASGDAPLGARSRRGRGDPAYPRG